MSAKETFEFVVDGSPTEVRARLSERGQVRSVAGAWLDFHLVPVVRGNVRPIIQARLRDLEDGTTAVVGALIIPERDASTAVLSGVAALAAAGWAFAGGGAPFLLFAAILVVFGVVSSVRRVPGVDSVVEQVRCAATKEPCVTA